MSVQSIDSRGADSLDLLALWQLMWQRKFLIAAVVLGCAVIAAIRALLATPMYRAEALLVEGQDQGMSAAAGLASQLSGLASLGGINIPSGGTDGREAQALLHSRRLIEEYIARNKLEALLTRDGPSGMWFAVDRFQRDVLSVQEDTRKGTTTVAVRWTDAATAAQWANGLVVLANDLMRARAIEDSTRNIAYLKSQVAQTDVVDLQRVMYNLIENETKSLMLANVRADYAFRIVDPATVSQVRISPRRTFMVLVGTIVGAGLGVLLVLILNLRAQYQGRSASPAAGRNA